VRGRETGKWRRVYPWCTNEESCCHISLTPRMGSGLRHSCSLTWKILPPRDENVCEPEVSMKPRVRWPTIEEGRGVIAADLIGASAQSGRNSGATGMQIVMQASGRPSRELNRPTLAYIWNTGIR
jgi:hypothetical protein